MSSITPYLNPNNNNFIDPFAEKIKGINLQLDSYKINFETHKDSKKLTKQLHQDLGKYVQTNLSFFKKVRGIDGLSDEGHRLNKEFISPILEIFKQEIEKLINSHEDLLQIHDEFNEFKNHYSFWLDDHKNPLYSTVIHLSSNFAKSFIRTDIRNTLPLLKKK